MGGTIKLEKITKQLNVYHTALNHVNKFNYSGEVGSDTFGGFNQDDIEDSKRHALSDFEKQRHKLNNLVEIFLENSSKYQLSPEDFAILKTAISKLPDKEIHVREREYFDAYTGTTSNTSLDLVISMRKEQGELVSAIDEKQKEYKQLDAVIEHITDNLSNKYLSEKGVNRKMERVEQIGEIILELGAIKRNGTMDPKEKANATRGCLLKYKKELGIFDHGKLSKQLNLLLKEPALQTGNSQDSDIKSFNETLVTKRFVSAKTPEPKAKVQEQKQEPKSNSFLQNMKLSIGQRGKPNQDDENKKTPRPSM